MNWSKLMAANEQIARDKVEYDREQDRLFEEEVRKHMESWEWSYSESRGLIRF